VPGRTVTNLEASTVVRLSKIGNIVGVKEASKNLEQIGEIVRDTPSDFLVYSGDDGTTLPILAIGGVGVVSVISHVNGNDIQAMIKSFFAGDLAEAIRLHGTSLALTKALFAFPSPSPAKNALNLLGLLPSTTVRLPLVDATEAEREGVKAALREYGLLAG
jgi:4-hydroxy-tetrahydrodipicolinate synthase